MKNMLLLAAALQAVLGTAALACDGQSGAMIFQDKFADDTGGWDLSASEVKIVPPAMEVTLNKMATLVAVQNLTFNAGDGDYCMQVNYPPRIDKNEQLAGITFWGTDYNNYFLFVVGDSGGTAFYKRVAGAWNQIFGGVKIDGFTATASVHTILVRAKAGTLTFSVDGKKVKMIRAQMPAGPLKFGPMAEVAVALTAGPPWPVFKISEFSVTAGQ